MRTTLTIDDDLADRLKEFATVHEVPFRQAVNDTLRKGLEQNSPTAKPTPFIVHPFESPFRAGIDSQRLNQLLDELDADAFVTMASAK